MEGMETVLGSLSLMQYSTGIMKKAMNTEAESVANLLNMLPQQQSFQVRGPQPGSVPAISKGNFIDVYA